MNTSQLHSVLSSDNVLGPYFVGVFPCDQLPTITSFPCALVANTDHADEKGEHWVAFYFDVYGNIEYFDSFGLAPVNCELYQFFQNNGYVKRYNSEQLQGMTTKVCGHYCIAFLTKRIRGQSMDTIVKYLKKTPPGSWDIELGNLVTTAFQIKRIPTIRQAGSGIAIGDGCIIQSCCSRIHCKRIHV